MSRGNTCRTLHGAELLTTQRVYRRSPSEDRDRNSAAILLAISGEFGGDPSVLTPGFGIGMFT